MENFTAWFRHITGYQPFPYQVQLAESADFPLFLDAATGAGKTAAVVLAWVWRRFYHSDETIRRQTPRRLAYCLPTRSLVDQTTKNIKTWLSQIDPPITLYQLMGGKIEKDWVSLPEYPCIVVGTQDQLLSRALNRGYSMNRHRWPIDFALLNNDCLWVMDETQLMGNGLRTTAQLQGFREQFKGYGRVQSLWMSATLHREQVETVDYKPDLRAFLGLSEADLQADGLRQRFYANKPLQQATTVWDGGKETAYAKKIVPEILAAHQDGQLTLVICNQVARSQAIYQHLPSDTEKRLIHSRFRAEDRSNLQGDLDTFTGIVVATQAIEAGVDISAAVLFTELAPWPSLVQRFGRCNRRGEQDHITQVYWIDYADLNKKNITLPYTVEAMETGRKELQSLDNVSPATLSKITVEPETIEGLIPRKADILQLFDTSTDLMGHDIDVSPFIRDSQDTDVLIAWREWQGKGPPEDTTPLQPPEFCRVSLPQAAKYWQKVRVRNPAYRWERSQGEWVRVEKLYPGLAVMFPCKAGGYSSELGFTGNPKDREFAEINPNLEQDNKNDPAIQERLSPDSDDDNSTTQVGGFVSLYQHSQDVAAEVKTLLEAVPEGLQAFQFNSLQEAYDWDENLVQRLIQAGLYHDVGKAHRVFQHLLTQKRDERENGLWAKSDHTRQERKAMKPPDDWRRGFRHEWASALVALEEYPEDFLLAYLVACHHGKVRMTVQARPRETKPSQPDIPYALGVWEGDEIERVKGITSQDHKLTLHCIALGKESWRNRAIALLHHHGPFKLAYLETLLRIADWRGSVISKQ